jgi:hypothetical protein
MDPAAGKDLESERARILLSLKQHSPAPSLIVDSGNGYQAFWLLKDPIRVKDPALIEKYNKYLEKRLGADHCGNIDRVMRVPGTVNLPGPKKQALGRQPALASIVFADWEVRYSLADFELSATDNPAQPKTAETNASSTIVPADVSLLLAKSVAEGERSEHVFNIIAKLVMAGFVDDTIVSQLASSPAGERYDGDVNKIRAEVSRCRQKILVQTSSEDTEYDPIDKLNEEFALVMVGHSAAILKESRDADGRLEIIFWGIDAFKTWCRNKLVIDADGKKRRMGEYWLDHPRRRQYRGVCFAPGIERQGYYNLWRGWAVAPKQGTWHLFKAHLLDNLCRGDEVLLQWVIGWFAAIVQYPRKKMGTSLVIRGKEGTGKTKIGEIFGSLFGPHYQAVSDPRYVTGQFNSHMSSCLLLHAEEAFWAADHRAESKLKDMVTGVKHMIEFEGKEPIMVDNFVRLLVTGNPDWVVPVSLQARRFAVLEIGEAHMRDNIYFAAIDAEMDNGGREALMYDLLHFDLGAVDLRTVPKTAALLDQKFASLTPEQSWWLDLLQAGRLPYGTGAASFCARELLCDHFVEHARRVGTGRRSSQTRLGMFLSKYVPGLTSHLGDYLAYNRECTGQVYAFPPLSECRAAFEKLIEQKIDWVGPDDWLEEPKQPPPEGQPM